MPDSTVHTRAVAVKPTNFDLNTRTFTGAVLATNRPIRVRGGIEESLDLAGAQFPECLPLLLDHRSDVRNTIGRVTNIRLQGGELLGNGRLTSDPSTDWVSARIADGTIGALSIGYVAERTSNGNGRTRTVVPRLLHASLVSEPADDNAGIRSRDDGEDRGDDGEGRGDRQTCNARIRALCRSLELGREIEDRAIDQGWGNQQIMDAILERGGHNIRVTSRATGLDDPAVYRSSMADNLVHRMSGSEAQGPARELQSLSWADLHRRHLRQAGQGVAGLSDVEVITRALSTSDMPLIAGSAVNIVLRRTYEAALSPIMAVLGSRTLQDFRPQVDALVDWTPLKIARVAEMGEYKSSYVSETGEEITLYTIGGITGVSRQLWINGASGIKNLSEAHGRRLAADVSDRLIVFLEQNSHGGPKMKDSYSVFDDTHHGNVATLDTTNLDTVITGVLTARAAASKRKGAGDVMIGVAPTIWIVEPGFEPTAIRALAQVAAVEVGNVNPLAGRLTLVTDPRLSDPDVSYLVASPTAMEGFVRVSLAGAEGPHTESRWGFEVDAVQFKIRLDLGFACVEHRAWTRLDHDEAGP